jgi:FkbM family methyltransferase
MISSLTILEKKIIRFFMRLGIGITSTKNLASLREESINLANLRNLMAFQNILGKSRFEKSIEQQILEEFPNSKSQLHQDLIALGYSNFKTGGFFVEFGATNGIKFSNTYLLEKKFEWQGILAEPAKNWHSELINNRSCNIETKCVWELSNQKLLFNETNVGELSTIDSFSLSDLHAEERSAGNIYEVETISLNDLLEKYRSPSFIDYLSIDTEGSEFLILRNLNFEKYKFRFISCEHNYTNNRELIFELLTSKGYKRVHEELSLFDDWYVSEELERAY